MRQPEHAPDSPASTGSADHFITLGRIIGLHGVRGWVKVHSDTDPRENIFQHTVWSLSRHGERRQFSVIHGRPQGKGLVAQLAGIADRDAASAWVGWHIEVRREELPDTAEGEYYWADLIGCEVFVVDGQRLGTAIKLFETGANDVLVIKDERSAEADPVSGRAGSMLGRERVDQQSVKRRPDILVPWVQGSVICSVDIVTKRIEIDWDPDCLS